jgi:muramoyltetrapeptide carboxypeptidase LdcA involved in peptidoglycan recycling
MIERVYVTIARMDSCWCQGKRCGHLIGGCFEVVDWLRGMDFRPAPEVWQNAILLIETSEEAPSPDAVMYGLRALRQWAFWSDFPGGALYVLRIGSQRNATPKEHSSGKTLQ